MLGVNPLEESLIITSLSLYISSVHYYNKITLRNKVKMVKSRWEIVKMVKCVIIVI